MKNQIKRDKLSIAGYTFIKLFNLMTLYLFKLYLTFEIVKMSLLLPSPYSKKNDSAYSANQKTGFLWQNIPVVHRNIISDIILKVTKNHLYKQYCFVQKYYQVMVLKIHPTHNSTSFLQLHCTMKLKKHLALHKIYLMFASYICNDKMYVLK